MQITQNKFPHLKHSNILDSTLLAVGLGLLLQIIA